MGCDRQPGLIGLLNHQAHLVGAELSSHDALDYLPGFVQLHVSGLDASDLFLIKKNGRRPLGELLAGEHSRAPDGDHQLVTLHAPGTAKRPQIDVRLTMRYMVLRITITLWEEGGANTNDP
jgi:hypothetical protein